MTRFETSFRSLGGATHSWWRRATFGARSRPVGWLTAAIVLALPIVAIAFLLIIVPVALVLAALLVVVGFLRAGVRRIGELFSTGRRDANSGRDSGRDTGRHRGSQRGGMSEGGRENVRVVR
jgi:hypothetical protein